jgi:hypothetical protein
MLTLIALLYCTVACRLALVAYLVVDKGLLPNFSMTKAVDVAAHNEPLIPRRI